ncbi:MAG TPA: D-serine ammonia-lyase [Edaphocola sp.]|nr:D-serine ammonia-lyase [Edaphocola sp.]
MATAAIIENWIKAFPELLPIVEKKEVLWLNPYLKSFSNELKLPIQRNNMEETRLFMEKYASFMEQVFPELAAHNGHLLSPLKEIENFKNLRNIASNIQNTGRFFIKCDNDLPVAGSIKARGGFFEVLQFAHILAIKEGLIKENEVLDVNKHNFKTLFNKYTIGVGSTGNLGLSIGIISAQLGFHVNVYMSNDAKEWKKNLLREKGANVIESEGDFGIAIAKGRKETLENPMGYFVDDENSRQLYLGYSLGAYELKQQLDNLNIKIDKEHPLFVYSPCGVGGSPGGVLWGLKNMFGDDVHSFFVEPTHSPSVLTGIITGEGSKISVQEIGLDNITEADGLAVGRPSAFATGITQELVSGIYTIEDPILRILLKELYQTEGIFIEPSATAGLVGPERVLPSNYIPSKDINPDNITHIAWSTGGSLMPQELKNNFISGNEMI